MDEYPKFKTDDKYTEYVKSICKFLNENIDKNFKEKKSSIEDTVKQISENYKQGNYFKMYELINTLLDDILNYKDIINNLIILYNEYYLDELNKYIVNEETTTMSFFDFFKDEPRKLKNIKETKFLEKLSAAYNISQNKSIMSDIFTNIKSKDKFREAFVKVMKHFITRLIDTCTECSCSEYKKISDFTNNKIKETTIMILEKYIEELK